MIKKCNLNIICITISLPTVYTFLLCGDLRMCVYHNIYKALNQKKLESTSCLNYCILFSTICIVMYASTICTVMYAVELLYFSILSYSWKNDNHFTVVLDGASLLDIRLDFWKVVFYPIWIHSYEPLTLTEEEE